MNKKTYTPLYFLAFMLSVFFSKAQNIQTVNTPIVLRPINPGSFFSIFIDTIENDSIQKYEVELPDGWKVLLTKKIKEEKYLYTFSTPPTTTSGKYEIIFKTLMKNNTYIRRFQIEIARIRKVEVFNLPTSEFVKEGDSLHIDYVIQNLGNDKEKIKISSSQGKLNFKYDTLTLGPNKSIQVKISKKIPMTESNYWIYSNDLSVMMKDSATPVVNYLSIPVYSTNNKKSDPFLRFPIEIGGGYNTYKIGNSNYIGYFYHINGNGNLDFGKKHYLDFTIHGPNQILLPAVGTYDQYTAKYILKDKLTIMAGDYQLSFNNLMEFGRFGRGLYVDYKFQKLGIMTFYTKPRFFPNQKQTIGGKLYYALKPNTILSLNLFSKNLRTSVASEWFKANFIGISLSHKQNNLSITTELSTSVAQGNYGFGVFNRFYYHRKKIQLGSDLVYSTKNFHGFYHNSRQASNTINYFFQKKWSIALQSNFIRINPSFDTFIFNSSPYYSNNGVMLNYDIRANQRFLLGYFKETNQDRSTIKQFDYRDKYMRFSYLINQEKFNLWYENRYGYVKNYLLGSDKTVTNKGFRTMIQPNIKILPFLWMGAFFEHQNTTKFSAANQRTNYFFYGLNTRIFLKDNFNFYFSYRNNYAPDELVRSRNFLDLTAELNLKHHKLTLMGGRVFLPSPTIQQTNTVYFMLRYALKLNTPLTKNKKIGNIKGNLVGENINKAGVLVSVGDKKYLTDNNGNFYFNDLPADKYHIMIDRSSLKQDGVISGQNTPFEVAVDAQKTNEISIPLVISGNIRGKIEVEKQAEDNKKTPIILIKLHNEQESFMTKANEKGIFIFHEIRPGPYNIDAYIYTYKDDFFVEVPTQKLIVEANKEHSVNFKVIKKERKIYFSNKSFEVSAKR